MWKVLKYKILLERCASRAICSLARSPALGCVGAGLADLFLLDETRRIFLPSAHHQFVIASIFRKKPALGLDLA
jgi:hypothetical protein